jgi:hypothetical protein
VRHHEGALDEQLADLAHPKRLACLDIDHYHVRERRRRAARCRLGQVVAANDRAEPAVGLRRCVLSAYRTLYSCSLRRRSKQGTSVRP